MKESRSQTDYENDFEVGKGSGVQERALCAALDIRKFEIEMYWRRATYFWTFIGASFLAWGVVQNLSNPLLAADLSVYVSCLGFLFSFAWFFANKGAKQWQENWENHVDLLEDEVVGPLYKTVLKRPLPQGKWRSLKLADEFLTGPGRFSVSKINQLVSLYVVLVWFALIVRAAGPSTEHPEFSFEYAAAIGVTLFFCVLIVWRGGTYSRDYFPNATARETEIQDD